MKIKSKTKNQNSFIKLKLLQTKSYKKKYFFENLKIEDVLYRLIKSFKILTKYNFLNKKIVFLNNHLIINIKFRHFLKKTNHFYKINYIQQKNIAGTNNHLLFVLNKPKNQKFLNNIFQTKIPLIFLLGSFKNFKFIQLYKIIGSFLYKQGGYSFFFVMLISLLKKWSQFTKMSLIKTFM